MSVDIPLARVADLQIRPVLFSGNQEGTLGGASLPIPRLGDRFAVDIVTAKFGQDAQSRLLMASLFLATTNDARIALRQPNRGRKISPGAVVHGADQGGTLLSVRGLFPGTSLLFGDLFSIVHAGVHFLYMVAGGVEAGVNGRAQVPIWPMLRFLTIDGERCAFDAPMIEGQLIGFDKGVGFDRNRTKPINFTIQERA